MVPLTFAPAILDLDSATQLGRSIRRITSAD